MKCRLCNCLIEEDDSIQLDVPAGTQLFSDDAQTALTLKARLQILECTHCSLIQLKGDPVVYENISSSSSFVSPLLTEHRLDQLKELFTYHQSINFGGRMLEIGCGDGCLLESAQNLFQDVVGIEPTSRNAALANSKGLSVHKLLMLSDTVVPGEKFDFFSSFHVLEHVTDICSVLQGIYNSLKDGGVGIIEVPSIEAAFEKKRFGDFMPDHLNYFTEHNLRLALEWNGFSVLKIYRDWGGEHLVAYARKRTKNSSLTYIVNRKKMLEGLISLVNIRELPFVVWGVSHYILPYIGVLSGINSLMAIDVSSEKVGKYIPSTNIKVHPIDFLDETPSCLVAVAAPRFQNEILLLLSQKYKQVKEELDLSDLLGFPIFRCGN